MSAVYDESLVLIACVVVLYQAYQSGKVANDCLLLSAVLPSGRGLLILP